MARILVVDDDPYVRGAVRRVLIRWGHGVWGAADGLEALQMLELLEVDLILTDVVMPRMDGLEFVQRARSVGVLAPIVVMTGGGLASREELLRAARERGAVRTIQKPFSARELFETLDAVLREPAMPRLTQDGIGLGDRLPGGGAPLPPAGSPDDAPPGTAARC